MTKIGRIKGANSDYQYDPQAQQIVETAIDDQENPVELSIFVCPHRQPSRVEQHSGSYCVGTDQACPSGQDHGHALLKLHQDKGVLLQAQQSTLNVNEGVLLQAPKSTLNVKEGGVLLKNQESTLNVAQDITLAPQDQGRIKLTGALELPEKVYLKNNVEIAPNPSEQSSPSALTLTLDPQRISLSIAPADLSSDRPAGETAVQASGLSENLTDQSTDSPFQITLSTHHITLSGPNQARIVLDHTGAITLTPGKSANVKINGSLEVAEDLILTKGNITSQNKPLTFNNTPVLSPLSPNAPPA